MDAWIEDPVIALWKRAVSAITAMRKTLYARTAAGRSQSMEDIAGRAIAADIQNRRLLKEFSPEAHDNLRLLLLDLEKSTAVSADPLHLLRAALLDHTETWKVLEVIDDISHGGWEDDDRTAQAMRQLLAQRFDYAKSPDAYWAARLAAEVLRQYLDANFPECLATGWWHAYQDDIFERTSWLERVVRSFGVVSGFVADGQCARPDEKILDQWRTRMLDARKQALEQPVDYGKRQRSWF
jgi:hypothetical protein